MVCVVVVCVVLELESGVDWLGEVDCCVLGDVCDVLGEVGAVCATTQAVDSSRIAVIRYTFFISNPPNTFSQHELRPLKVIGSSAKHLDKRAPFLVCLMKHPTLTESRAAEMNCSGQSCWKLTRRHSLSSKELRSSGPLV